MNRRQLAASFADQSTPRGRASTLYFDGPVCYSYGEHYPLAVIFPNKSAMMNDDDYSKSTAVHYGSVYAALVQAGYTVSHGSTGEMKAAVLLTKLK